MRKKDAIHNIIPEYHYQQDIKNGTKITEQDKIKEKQRNNVENITNDLTSTFFKSFSVKNIEQQVNKIDEDLARKIQEQQGQQNKTQEGIKQKEFAKTREMFNERISRSNKKSESTEELDEKDLLFKPSILDKIINSISEFFNSLFEAIAGFFTSSQDSQSDKNSSDKSKHTSKSRLELLTENEVPEKNNKSSQVEKLTERSQENGSNRNL